MGGGQKGVWSELLPKTNKALDANDPNFDSEGEENVVLVTTAVTGSPRKTSIAAIDPSAGKEYTTSPPIELKKKIIEILEEYFSSGDVDEVRK